MSAKAILADMEEAVKMASISLFATVYLVMEANNAKSTLTSAPLILANMEEYATTT